MPPRCHFLELPFDVQVDILRIIDYVSLRRLTETCKGLRETVFSLPAALLAYELKRAGLVSLEGASVKDLLTHNKARFRLPIATQRKTMFGGDVWNPRSERLFRGFFALVSEEGGVTVWNLRQDARYATEGIPRLLVEISPFFPGQDVLGMAAEEWLNAQDIVFIPENNLLALLCYTDGAVAERQRKKLHIILLGVSFDGSASLVTVDKITYPHPEASLPRLIVSVGPGADLEKGRRLYIANDLLALTYSRDMPRDRRGVVWNWRTGQLIYDSHFSGDFDPHPHYADYKAKYTRGFHHLLLLEEDAFVVSTTAPMSSPEARSGCIEVWRVELAEELPAADGRLGSEPKQVAHCCTILHLPKISEDSTCQPSYLEFHTGEPPIARTFLNTFNSTGMTGYLFAPEEDSRVHVLQLSFEQDGLPTDLRFPLVLRNNFLMAVAQGSIRFPDCPVLDLPSAIPLPSHIPWENWGAEWTIIPLEMTKDIIKKYSVHGSRVAALSETGTALHVVDFNLRFRCRERRCRQLHQDSLIIARGLWKRYIGYMGEHHYIAQNLLNNERYCDLIMDEERMIFILPENSSELPSSSILGARRWVIRDQLINDQNADEEGGISPSHSEEEEVNDRDCTSSESSGTEAGMYKRGRTPWYATCVCWIYCMFCRPRSYDSE